MLIVAREVIGKARRVLKGHDFIASNSISLTEDLSSLIQTHRRKILPPAEHRPGEGSLVKVTGSLKLKHIISPV